MTRLRPTWVEVDLAAIAHNVRALTFPGAEVMALVKADGYGHGDVAVARAALGAGATWLGVALVEEGLGLRAAGIEAPILVLSECPPGSEVAAVAAALTPTVRSSDGLDRLAAAASTVRPTVGVHVKVDTGMHRVGLWPPEGAVGFVDRVVATGLELDGLWTHLACADTDEMTTRRQLDLFAEVLERVRAAGHRPTIVHAANTAGAVRFPSARFDLVRAGIGIYGLEPAPGIGDDLGLRPALTWRSAVALVKRLPAGSRVSYGHRYELAEDAWVATVPVGYADGYPRMLSSRRRADRRASVPCRRERDDGSTDRGLRRRRAGPRRRGRAARLQGLETVTAWELAGLADTIAYEIVARIGARVPRRTTNEGAVP